MLFSKVEWDKNQTKGAEWPSRNGPLPLNKLWSRTKTDTCLQQALFSLEQCTFLVFLGNWKVNRRAAGSRRRNLFLGLLNNVR